MGNRNRAAAAGHRFTSRSVLWKYLAMMLTILLLAVSAMVITNVRSHEELTKENLARFQAALDRDCLMLGSDMYSSSAIPASIADSRHFEYIEYINDGDLDPRYYPLLLYIRRALLNQVYLEEKNDYSMLYLNGCNSIVTHGRVYPKASVCLEQDFRFSATAPSELLDAFNTYNGITLFPMQEITIPDGGTDLYLPLVLHPTGSKISILTLYSDETVLHSLGLASLPEDTHLRLMTDDGQTLWQYPQAVTEENEEHYYQLNGVLSHLNVTVNVWIPQEYLGDIIQPIQWMSIGVVILVTVLGTSLSYVFSKLSVEPIRRIVEDHSGAQPLQGKNELHHLDLLLTRSRKRSKDLTNMLNRVILSRAISGSVLTQKDEQFLAESLGSLCHCYRIAIVQSSPDISPALCDHLSSSLHNAFCVLINDSEVGVLFDSGTTTATQWNHLVETLNEANSKGDIRCGISAQARSLSDLHVAVRQARVSLPRTASTNVFPAETVADTGTSWLQQERFYQSICEQDEQSTLSMLEKIAEEVRSDNVRYIFHNMLFAIYSAAGEMDVDLPAANHTVEYMPDLTPGENIHRLSGLLRDLFSMIRDKINESLSGDDRKLLDFIRGNFADDYMSAPFAAEQLKLSEKKVYETVRTLTGLSFSEYLLSLRMKHAAHLLRTTDLSIGEVAQQCGYQVESTFYRLFKKFYNISPGQYRRMGGL